MGPDHPLVPVLEDWLAGGDPAREAVACNLVCDHRVSELSERLLTNEFLDSPESTASSRLEDALRTYKEKYVRAPRLPQFSGRANRVNRADMGAGLVDRDVVRVLDLGGMDGVFRVAERRAVPIASFKSYSAELRVLTSHWPTADEALLRWLDQRLQDKGDDEVTTFVNDVVTAIYPSDEELRTPGFHGFFHPTWVAKWAEFRRFLGSGPERWSGVVGVPNSRRIPRWLLLLRYRLPKKVPLLRPTSLDAGYNPYHFPSPPQAPVSEGGYPMDLRWSSPAGRLISEFIHRQVPYPSRRLSLRHFRIARTTGPLPEEGALPQRRRAHYRRLRRRYLVGVDDWMPREML